MPSAPREPQWHGWGIGSTSVAVGPSPDGSGQYILTMAVDGESYPMAAFLDRESAEEVMEFFDVAFSQTARANQELATLLAET